MQILEFYKFIFLATMARGISWCFLLLIIAVGSIQAQNNDFYDPSEILFPGETERPAHFPLQTTAPAAPSLAYIQCFENCQSTSEYEPLCGTDHVVYSNQGRLQCARNCGKQVRILKYGQCNNSRGPAGTGTTSSPLSAIYNQCFNSCLSTSEYNPVCGTDYVVYQNIGKLRCAQDCGNPVRQLKPGRCLD